MFLRQPLFFGKKIILDERTHQMMKNWTPTDLENELKNGTTFFLKLWKKGCGACKLSEPALERIMESGDFKIDFAQISTDDHPEILEITESEMLPVFFVFKDKEMKGRFEGFKGLEKMKSFIGDALK